MNNMKFNMGFAALLCAGIIAMLAGFIARTAVTSHHLEKDAVQVEAATSDAGGAAAAVQMPEPILALIAKADVEHGKAVSKACQACHNFDPGGPNAVGPNLNNVVGRKKMSHPGFEYSGALTEHGGDTWTLGELNKFIWKPKAYASGTKMNFIGIKKTEDRAALIAYLRSLDNHPEPTPAEIAAEAKDLAPAEAKAAGAAPAVPAKDAKAPAKDAKGAPGETKPAPAGKAAN